ncbi:TMEM165/GDT1 family protein [Nocardioides insulae]|uniref:TMEM165/GDT1 family protein n=1 Tax=Nocardioides insulae TaxID=394734 RepID=UPI0003FE2F28|nr:TMEM165/GDT1 family protein [Nocardioides insulae]
MDPAIIALAFGAIFVVELPDKTFLATLVLATKYRPILVWIGVCAAFFVQTVVAVALGHAASFLPATLVGWLAAALFLFGAIVLFREGRSHQQDDGEEFAEKAKPATGFKAVLASFLVLFVAEWGDLSQLLTMSLVAKYEEPIAVFIGAFAALATVSGLAVLAGRALMKRVSLHILHYVGAAICALLFALTVWELVA